MTLRAKDEISLFQGGGGEEQETGREEMEEGSESEEGGSEGSRWEKNAQVRSDMRVCVVSGCGW